tara:strand:- start:636 stop:752 length:117 start_codon:yes stop_codon:yes gene_type:complete
MNDNEMLFVATMALAFLVVGLLAIYAHFKEKQEKSEKN